MKNIKFIAIMLIIGALMTGCSSKKTHENTAGGSDGITRTEESVNDGTNSSSNKNTSKPEHTGNNMMDDVVDNTENAVGDVGDAAGNVIDDAGNIVEDAGDAVGDAANGIGDATKDMTN